MLDNASTYLAAAEELELPPPSRRLWGDVAIHSQEGTWFSGFWERLIGLTKQALRKTLSRTLSPYQSWKPSLLRLRQVSMTVL